MKICIDYETKKGSPILEISIGSELIPDLGSQPAGVQSHKRGSSLPLLSARPIVNSLDAEHHCPLACTKLYCIVTEARVCINDLPRVALGSAEAGIRTRDLMIASPVH